MSEESSIAVDIILPENWKQPIQYRLREDIELCNVLVESNFVTDGASVPRLFWPVFPAVGRYFEAAVIHDYLLEHRTPWFDAADIFEDALKATDIPKWRRMLMVGGVRLWGGVKYMKGDNDFVKRKD